MKVAKIYSAANLGLDSFGIEVEVDIGAGLPSFSIVGLPDKAIDESKERIRAAIKNIGVKFPQHRLTINLAPADIKKEGPSFDLPMAVGILLASEQLQSIPEYKNALFLGELALDGRLRPIAGVLPAAIYAREKGFKRIYLPHENANEAALIDDLEIIPTKSLKDLVRHLRSELILKSHNKKYVRKDCDGEVGDDDFCYVSGQEQAKRALEIAAAGNHNIAMSGPPGSGKTMLARALTTILPSMDRDEILDVTKIYSVAGMLTQNDQLIERRPFRSPHHTTSSVAVVGGGQWPRPGEISLAHRGVLFLDEFPEFPRSVLEALRQPLEDGVVTVSRAQGSLSFPAEFLLVAAQNPCPCGYLTDPDKQCSCSPSQINRYQKKISGPLLDRIDIHIEVPRVKYEKLTQKELSEPSKSIRERIERARDIQRMRFKATKTKANSEMSSRELKEFCELEGKGAKLLRDAMEKMSLSARSYNRIIKVAQTVADLEGSDYIRSSHVAEALQYRQQDQIYRV